MGGFSVCITKTMTGDPLKLDQIQKWMQSVITHPEGVVAGVESPDAQSQIPVTPNAVDRIVGRSQSLTSLERLQIYGNAYYARLVECLRDEFPVVAYALGEESFAGYALGYLQSYPSQSDTLSQLGANLPRFLAEIQTDHAPELSRFLVDLARLERIYSEVFDGPGSEGEAPLSPESLAEIPPDAWPEVKLLPVPSLRLERFAFPVHEFVTSVRKESSPKIPEPANTYLAINRRDFIVRRAAVSALQYELLGNLIAGLPLGEAISKSLENSETDFDELAGQLQAWFQDWTTWQFFAGVEVRTDQKPNPPREPADAV
jgi:hypothetical protein